MIVLNSERLNQVNNYSSRPTQLESYSDIGTVFVHYLLNVITLGIYSTCRTLSLQSGIKEINHKKILMQTEAGKINQEWNRLRSNLTSLEGEFNDLTSEEGDRQLNHLSAQRDFSHIELPLEKKDHFAAKVSHAVQTVFQFIAYVAVNCLTLGIYGVCRQYALNNRLKEEWRTIESSEYMINQDLSQISDLFTSRLQLLRDSLRQKERNQAFMASEKGIAYTHLQVANGNLEIGNQTLNELQNEARRIQEQINANTDESDRLGTSFNRVVENNANLRDEINGIQNTIPVQNRLIERLILDKTAAEGRFTEAERLVEPVRQLQQQVQTKQLEQTQGPLGDMVRTQATLGPIAPKYEKKASDRERVNGARGIENEYFKATYSAYAERVNDLSTGVEVIEASFDYAFDWLIENGRQKGITFNKSSKILEDEKYYPNQFALYHFMTLDLIKHAKLDKDSKGNYFLKLNNQNVTMGASQPERVATMRIDVNGNRIPGTAIKLNYLDDFSPSMHDGESSLGIDPVSVKWIYEQLSEEERNHLFTLLMAPLIPESHRDLIRARQFMRNAIGTERARNAQAERVKLVNTAYELISNISVAYGNRYRNILSRHWFEKADNDDDQPFTKEVKADSSTSEAIAEWIPNMDVLSNHGADEVFAAGILDAQIHNKAVLSAMSREAVRVPRENSPPAELTTLKEQYYHSHKVFNAGCLFSNLLVIVSSNADQVNDQNAEKLKTAVAAYLDDEAVAERFKAEIQAVHGVSVAEYKNWMRGNVRNINIDYHNFGTLEIQMVAEMMGVRIGVFTQGGGTKLNEYGLMVPARPEFYFGPNTKETLYIYNAQGFSYYGLFPKVNAEALSDVSENIETVQNYWNRVTPSVW